MCVSHMADPEIWPFELAELGPGNHLTRLEPLSQGSHCAAFRGIVATVDGIGLGSPPIANIANRKSAGMTHPRDKQASRMGHDAHMTHLYVRQTPKSGLNARVTHVYGKQARRTILNAHSTHPRDKQA